MGSAMETTSQIKMQRNLCTEKKSKNEAGKVHNLGSDARNAKPERLSPQAQPQDRSCNNSEAHANQSIEMAP